MGKFPETFFFNVFVVPFFLLFRCLLVGVTFLVREDFRVRGIVMDAIFLCKVDEQ